MAYVTRDDIVLLVKGEERLRRILLPLTGAEADAFIAAKILFATQFANLKLKAAGIATPLEEPITDEVLRSSLLGIVIGELTRGSANREPWMEKLEDAGRKYFDALAEEGADIVGAEERDDSDGWSGIIATSPDDPVFDGPNSEASHVFGQMSPPGFRRW